MNQAEPNATPLDRLCAERLVRYVDLKPCTTAFIDTRTPGRQQKENFTIIGPGVAENPDQFVHIELAHGFNIGGARQPPGCINSQHSHETAEVFIIHSGTWAFYLGSNCEDGEVVLHAGDTISIPIHVFRGFKNIGTDLGFMFAVLGGDDPGRVTWAPDVFELAARHGMILLEDGSLFDTSSGAAMPAGKRAMNPTTADDVAKAPRLTATQMADCVVSRSELAAEDNTAPLAHGLTELPVIGGANAAEAVAAGKINWPHGFHVRFCPIPTGTSSKWHMRDEEEVVLLLDGELVVEFDEGDIRMSACDVLTVPIGKPHRFANRGSTPASVFIVRGGDTPNPPRLVN